ncbi:MAG: hypothetical protein WCF12_08390 [Propionicimonas sp.]
MTPRGAVTLRVGEAPDQLEIALAGGPHFVEVFAEADVVEHEGSLGGLTIGQRISVAEHCQLRWVVEVPAEPVAPVRLDITVTATPGQAMWLWPGGADGFLAVLPARGAGPVLVVQAVQAELRVAHDHGDGRTLRLALTPVGLAVGRRHVVQLKATVLTDTSGLGALLPVWFASTSLAAGEEWSAPIADLGVEAGPEVTVSPAEVGSMVMMTAPPGLHDVTVHGLRGVTDVVLHVAPPLAEVVTSLAERLLAAGELTSAGAVIVQRALQAGSLRRTAEVEDALDRFDWTSRADLLAIAFGSERALAEGERAMAAEAVRRISELPVTPGSPRVEVLAWLAAATLGVAGVAGVPDAERSVPTDSLAGLEQDIVRGRRTKETAASLAAVLGRVGAGLPGYLVGLNATRHALLVGLLEGVPEGWPEAPLAAVAAQAARQQLLACYAGGDLIDVTPLAWLLISG